MENSEGYVQIQPEEPNRRVDDALKAAFSLVQDSRTLLWRALVYLEKGQGTASDYLSKDIRQFLDNPESKGNLLQDVENVLLDISKWGSEIHNPHPEITEIEATAQLFQRVSSVLARIQQNKN